MMEDLHIEYNNGKGQMTIHMNAFFPTSIARLKKLLKIIELDYLHREELVQKLKVYFQKKIPECEAAYQENGKKYFEYKQLEADTARMVESKKRPNGVPLSKDELKAERERRKEYADKYKAYLRMAKQYQRKKKQYSDNLEFLESK